MGAGFQLGERTHLLVSLERSEQDPIWGYDILDYDWYKARALLESSRTSRYAPTPERTYVERNSTL